MTGRFAGTACSPCRLLGFLMCFTGYQLVGSVLLGPDGRTTGDSVSSCVSPGARVVQWYNDEVARLWQAGMLGIQTEESAFAVREAWRFVRRRSPRVRYSYTCKSVRCTDETPINPGESKYDAPAVNANEHRL